MKRVPAFCTLFAFSLISLWSSVPSARAAQDLKPESFLDLLGAKGRKAGDADARKGYTRVFQRLDSNGDGRLSHEEYVVNGNYATERVRGAIFNATDTNKDKVATKAEYIENRAITDEAKSIMQKIDGDGNGTITAEEFASKSGIEKKITAEQVFAMLDTDGSGDTFLPEYLRAWGRIARAVPIAASPPPNIVFIMADDMGFGDVRALNPRSVIPTPNLDRLARDGMTFTDAHSPSAVCTPTRYGVITGRYCWRSRLKSGVLNGYSKPLIDPERYSVADVMNDAGYHTAVIGKWHLGLGFVQKEGSKNRQTGFDYTSPLSSTPNDNGFDESYVIPASLDFPPYVYIRNRRVTEPMTVDQPAQGFPSFLRKGPRSKGLIMEDVIDHLAAEAGKYLEARAADKKRFFLYLPLTSPHKPLLPHPRFRGKSKAGWYGDFVIQTDDAVGQILGSIEANGLKNNTLVIYTSDNGSYMRSKLEEPDHLADKKSQNFHPKIHRANGIYRGTKADVWESGHRVPFFARWPGKIEAGSKCAETITHTDLMATCAAIAKKDLPENSAEDSFSWLPLFEGRNDDFKRAPVINHSANGTFAIREGKWKLVLGDGSGGREAPRGKPFRKPYTLFDLEVDPSEQSDVIDKYPEVAKKLEAECLKLRDAGRSR